MVGGPTKGTRFRPLSFNTPKPLFPLAGQPMLHHPISACKSVLTSLFFDIMKKTKNKAWEEVNKDEAPVAK